MKGDRFFSLCLALAFCGIGTECSRTIPNHLNCPAYLGEGSPPTLMEKPEIPKFPPRLIVGNRVWTTTGFCNHGPESGPKVDIAPNQGGTITASQENSYTRVLGDFLHTVRWDNGQESKHYSRELFCIGRFQCRTEFDQAIKPVGVVELTVGPAGGFRHVRLELEYDGNQQTVELRDPVFWEKCLESIVKKSGRTISITRLPSKREIKAGM